MESLWLSPLKGLDSWKFSVQTIIFMYCRASFFVLPVVIIVENEQFNLLLI